MHFICKLAVAARLPKLRTIGNTAHDMCQIEEGSGVGEEGSGVGSIMPQATLPSGFKTMGGDKKT